MTFNPFEVDLVREVGSAGRQKRRPCLKIGAARGPAPRDFLDSAYAVRVNCAPEVQGVKDEQSSLDRK